MQHKQKVLLCAFENWIDWFRLRLACVTFLNAIAAIDPTIAPPESNLARLPLLRQLRRDDLDDEPGPSPEEVALRAGWAAGKALARAGLPRPTRDQGDELARDHGHGSLTTWFRHGLASGWAHERPPEARTA